MASRDFDTTTWSDKWFRSLKKPELKLLFIYLWTNDNCNQAGLYEVDPDLVELQCKVSLNGNAHELEPKIEYFPEHSIVWIKNFFKRQCKNRSFAYAALKSIRNFPPAIIQEWYNYNTKTLKSIGFNPQCKDGVITLPPTMPPQTSNKTRPDQGINKRSSTESITESHKPCQKCHNPFKPKYENHELCDKCFKESVASPSSKWVTCPHCGACQNTVKKGKPCPWCEKEV